MKLRKFNCHKKRIWKFWYGGTQILTPFIPAYYCMIRNRRKYLSTVNLCNGKFVRIYDKGGQGFCIQILSHFPRHQARKMTSLSLLIEPIFCQKGTHCLSTKQVAKIFVRKNLDRRWWPNAFSPSTYNIWGIHESMCALQGELWVQLQFHSYDESVVKRRFLFNKSMLILIKLCILLHTAVIISKNFLSM